MRYWAHMRTVLQQDGNSRTNRHWSHTAAIERQVKKVTLVVESLMLMKLRTYQHVA